MDYLERMRKRSSKPDINQLAASIVERSTTPSQPVYVNTAGIMVQESSNETRGKNPAAVALGRLGGLKGGKARSEKLSAQARKRIARRAANARWKKRKPATQ